MAIAQSAVGHEEEIGGTRRRLVLRNGEIERFEVQYAPFGIFELWDQLCGRGKPPQARHCRDLVALALVGGGMADTAADNLIASLPPADNVMLRGVAFRVLGTAFFPVVAGDDKKKEGGSDEPELPDQSDTTPQDASATLSG